MRVVFAGTPPFAVRALEALERAGHDIALVLTRPDRPSGRGLKLAASAVAHWAVAHDLSVIKPASLKQGDVAAALRVAQADVMVVAAYGSILPAELLEIPRKGCLNIHASLLPRWRGAAPIQRALLAGDAQTGICIMQMDAGLDTGPVLLEKRVPIGPRDTTGTLTQSLGRLGAEAIAEALANLDALTAFPQHSAAATHAPKLAKSEAWIDWRLSNLVIDRQVRALDPAPGAETTLHGHSLKIWEAIPGEGKGEPGEVLAAGREGLLVACGEGAINVTRLQRAGGKRLEAAEFLRGMSLQGACTLGRAAASPLS